MPVRKRGDRWHVRLQIGGQRIERSLGPAATKADALDYEAKLRKDFIDGKIGRAPERSIDDALVKWLQGEAAALSSYDNLLSKVRAIRPHCAGKKLSEIVDAAGEVKKAGLKAGLKPATINRRLAILRRIANLAYDEWEGWLDKPLGQKIKLLPGEAPRFVQLTVEQAETFMATVAPRSQSAILLAVMTGLREGELLRLDPAQHLRDGRIVLDAQTKTRKPRMVPLTPDANALAERWRAGGLTYAMLRRDFEQARAALGMPWLQFRDLRRTFGSWIVQRTGSLKAAQDLLGHSTVAITSQHYAHLLDKHLVDAVSTLPALKRGKNGADTPES